MRARSARSAVLAGAFALALATGGLAYGSSAGDDGVSTTGAQTAKAAPPGTAPAGGTAAMHAKQGVKPSKTIPKGSTRSAAPPTVKATPKKVVDKSDRGVKNVRPTKDNGRKNAASTRDLGAR
jgi:hypothetical protein